MQSDSNDALAQLMRSNSFANAPAAAPQAVPPMEPRSLSAPTYLPQLTAGNARSNNFEHVGGSSTRVLAPPGGSSSICFGSDDTAPAQPARRGRRQFAPPPAHEHAAGMHGATAGRPPRPNVLERPGGPSRVDLYGGYGKEPATAPAAAPSPMPAPRQPCAPRSGGLDLCGGYGVEQAAAPAPAPRPAAVAPPAAASPSTVAMEDLLAQRRRQRAAESSDFEAMVAAKMQALRTQVGAPGGAGGDGGSGAHANGGGGFDSVGAGAGATATPGLPPRPHPVPSSLPHVQQQHHHQQSGGSGGVSANAYANGASQNCGNVMTGRSTTRVAQAPGGTSQISFGSGDDVGRFATSSGSIGSDRRGGGGSTGSTAIVGAPAHRGHNASFNNPLAARVSANAYANGASQNCGNVMTGRSTTRVAQAPGGTSQISFGGGNFGADAAPQQRLRSGGRRVLGVLNNNTVGASSSAATAVPPPAHKMMSQSLQQPQRSMGARIGNTCQNTGNSILGRQSTRVHAPPGGMSQITFGGGGGGGGGDGGGYSTSNSSIGAGGRGEPAPAPASNAHNTGSHGIASVGGGGMGMARVSANAYANGANQNCGNVMTGRSTTRIHAPPGGTSQISFG